MLDQILEKTRHRVARLASRATELETAARRLPPGRDLSAALAAPGLQVIAEIKRRSPSAGDIASDLNPGVLAKQYVAGGAAAISVLTEPHFFGGGLDDLAAVRASVDVPLLRKDFVIDRSQLHEAKVAGADAVLLIVAALSEPALADLIADAGSVGLGVLVEAHDAAEVTAANNSGADLVGVNNRDLRTFVTDLGTAERLVPKVAAPVKVAESGVSSAAAARRMAAAGFDAVLVGEALVRAEDPGHLIGELCRAGAS